MYSKANKKKLEKIERKVGFLFKFLKRWKKGWEKSWKKVESWKSWKNVVWQL